MDDSFKLSDFEIDPRILRLMNSKRPVRILLRTSEEMSEGLENLGLALGISKSKAAHLCAGLGLYALSELAEEAKRSSEPVNE
jgi:hypothetical protein